MVLIKKVNPDWQPSEKPDLSIGETLEVTDYESLVKTGMGVLVDEAGNELEMPNQKFVCPVCFKDCFGLLEFVEHTGTHLSSRKAEDAVQSPVVEIAEGNKTTSQVVAEELAKQKKSDTYAKRLLALEKARAARKARVAQKKEVVG